VVVVNQPPGPPFGPPGQQPPQGYPPQQQQGYPPQQGFGGPPQPGFGAPGMQQQQQASSGVEWKWRYSRFVGVMYGPIPVGIIVVVVGWLIYMAVGL
jgi:hypothetical protein